MVEKPVPVSENDEVLVTHFSIEKRTIGNLSQRRIEGNFYGLKSFVLPDEVISRACMYASHASIIRISNTSIQADDEEIHWNKSTVEKKLIEIGLDQATATRMTRNIHDDSVFSFFGLIYGNTLFATIVNRHYFPQGPESPYIIRLAQGKTGIGVQTEFK